MSHSDRAFDGSIPELYEAYMGPMIFEPFARELAARFAGFEGRLLEIAAGTGRLTRALAATLAPQAEIVATDLNRPMLEEAQRRVTDPRISWREADAQALTFEDATFDAAACQFGAMFFPDRRGAYAEARRVLRPGAQFVFSVWDVIEANDLSQIVSEVVAAAFPDDPPDFFARTPHGYHDRDAIRADVRAAGFADCRLETVTLVTPAASAWEAALGLCQGTPLRQEIEARDPARLEAVTRACAEAIRARFGDGPIEGRGQAIVVETAA